MSLLVQLLFVNRCLQLDSSWKCLTQIQYLGGKSVKMGSASQLLGAASCLA